MRRTTAAACGVAAGCVAATMLTAPTASATVVSRVGLPSPGSFSNFTIGCRYEARVKVNDAATVVRLVESREGSGLKTVVARTIPAADTAVFVWTPTTPGRRTLQAVQPTRGRLVYSHPITVTVSRGITAAGFCFSV
ncbi:hypothetical protein [Gordonia araii]|nr:hypothetical protein [Gordonia araii]NNG95918.1 hypothetical protein [Gordonia araii NBRC 100433]